MLRVMYSTLIFNYKYTIGIVFREYVLIRIRVYIYRICIFDRGNVQKHFKFCILVQNIVRPNNNKKRTKVGVGGIRHSDSWPPRDYVTDYIGTYTGCGCPTNMYTHCNIF